MIRKAVESDIAAVAKIYSDIHTQEESGLVSIGWIRQIYPTEATARNALTNDELFVMEEDGHIVAAARINQTQEPMYAQGNWRYPADASHVMVLHTLVVSPSAARKGYGCQFVEFYESYARDNGCTVLRMDTNAKNVNARRMYKNLGYAEADIVSCQFNGIPDVQLVLLEKAI